MWPGFLVFLGDKTGVTDNFIVIYINWLPPCIRQG